MTLSADPDAQKRRRTIILVGSIWLQLVSAGGMYLIVVALKEVAEEFSWPREVPSLAFSLQFIGSGFGGIIMGHVLDRLGFGVPALVGVLMIGIGSILVSVIDAPWQLYLIYAFMIGVFGQGSFSAPAMANIARWYDERRGMAVGMVASGQSLAGIVWPPIFGYVLATEGWRPMFVWYGVFMLVVLLPVCWFVRSRPPRAAPPVQGGAGTGYRGLSPESQAMRPVAIAMTLCVAILGCCVAMALPLGHLVAHVSDLGHSITEAVEVLSAMLITAFLSRAVVVGFLSDRLGGLRALFIFSVVQATMLFALTVVRDLPAVYLVAALLGLGYGGIFPVYAVAVQDHMPLAQTGRWTGIVFLFGAIAMGFGSWMGGVLFDLTGSYRLPFLIGVACNLVNLAIVAYLIARLGLLRPRPRYI